MSGRAFDSIAIVGVGLIGSSIARAADATGVAGQVLLYDGNPAVEARLRELAIGQVSGSLAEAVADADLIVVATPPAAITSAARACLAAMKSGAILTDTGSTKREIARSLAPLVPTGVAYVPGHPVAGTEFSGPESGHAKLFEQRWCILAPALGTPPARAGALERVRQFWSALGARVEVMDPDRHDEVMAMTSHLPHLVAYALVGAALADRTGAGTVVRFSGGGFRDFTRIAASDPTMWRDIFLQNSAPVLAALDEFAQEMARLRAAIEAGDAPLLFEAFDAARSIRARIVGEGEDTGAPDFGRGG